MKFDTKIAVVLREDLPTWQKLNVTAFVVSGLGTVSPEAVGEAYEDASGQQYLPMFVQPVLVFAGSGEQVRGVYERAMRRGVRCAIYTEALFATGNDVDNRAAVRAVASADLPLVGLALRGDRNQVDKILKGLSLHP